MPQPIVVFDLDGTLVDTAADLIDSLNHALASAGVEPADHADMRPYAGFGGRFMLQRSFDRAKRVLAADRLEALNATFLEHYRDNIPGRTTIFPGVLAALDRLAADGHILAICTNKPSAMAVNLIGALGLAPRFAAIAGADTFSFRKPDPRHLFETIAMAGGDRSRAVMVGDSRTDVETAKNAGIPVVAVDFGYSDRPVAELEPSRVVSHFDAFTSELVAELIAGANR